MKGLRYSYYLNIQLYCEAVYESIIKPINPKERCTIPLCDDGYKGHQREIKERKTGRKETVTSSEAEDNTF